MTTREGFFQCSAASQTAIVSAWDQEQAEAMFREMLAEQGLKYSGEIVITTLAAMYRRALPTRRQPS